MNSSESKKASEPKRALRALVVEDLEDDYALLLMELRRSGYEPVTERVETAEGFRTALNRGGWDLIISDHKLPHFSSTAALALLRETGVDLPFIIVSGTIGEEVAVSAMKAGAHDYVMKGHLARLAPAIERELRDAESRRARRRAEAALRESEARYRELIEELPAVTYIAALDEEHSALYLSPQVEKMLGILPADHRHLWKNFLHPDDREYVMAELDHCRQSRAPFTCEYRMVAAGGRVVWVLDHGVVMKEQAERSLFMRGFMQDITEAKRSEEALGQKEDQIRKLQKLEAIGRLAGGVAHDFNNLLTPILGYGNMLMDRLQEDAESLEWMSEIVRAAERAGKLTRQLLAFSRKQIVQMRPIDINAIVLDMDRFLRRTIGEDVELLNKLGDQVGLVLADGANLEQVLMNLAVNARDAMSRGGRLTIRTSNVMMGEEDCRAYPGMVPGEYVLVVVQDTGCGMSPEVREHIFEPFYTTKPEGKGTGLGLSITHGIVQQSRGFIDVKSEEGVGTEFYIYLPRLHVASEEVVKARISKDLPRGSETILVVEDDQMVRDLTVLILESLGYRVLQAAGPGDAILVFEQRSHPIQLLITDVVMPHMSGRKLAERLLQFDPQLRVLYTSGFTANAIAHEGVLDDKVNLLQKPYTREDLAQTVRQVITQK